MSPTIFFKETNCEVTTEPMDDFGEARLFTVIDPFGYEWQITQVVNVMTPNEQKEAGKKVWGIDD